MIMIFQCGTGNTEKSKKENGLWTTSSLDGSRMAVRFRQRLFKI